MQKADRTEIIPERSAVSVKSLLCSAGRFFFRAKIYWLSFVVPAAVLFASYIFFQVWPFGERSVLSLDLNAQYVYYYDYMYDVFAGKESLFYSWSRNLSGEFAGIIGYYLASPFNFIVWAFPRTMITEGLMVMMIVKAGTSGLSMAYFLRKHRGYSESVSLCFSVMWALCGFFVVQTMNPMWLDGLIALPLIAAGVERICDKRRFKLYILSSVYIFVANFYIGYMSGIFSALYFIWYLSSGKSKNKHIDEYFISGLIYAVSSVCAVMMSCFMILPVYKSLSNGKFTFSVPDYSIAESFNIADIFIKLFPGTYDTVQMDGMPILYCGTLALVCAALYFGHRRIPARERIAGGVFIGIMALFMYVRPADMMWHGGQMPNWLPYRYSFMISFLLVIFGAEAFSGINRIRGAAFTAAFGVGTAMLIYADLGDAGKYYQPVMTVGIPLVLLAAAVILAYAVKRHYRSLGLRIAVCVFVGAECLGNTVMYLYKMHDDIVFSTRESYRWDIPYTREISDQIHEADPGFYRMEKTYHRAVNDTIAVRMYGMSHSSSTLNSKAIELLKSFGFAGRQHYTRYDGATMLTDDIFGVRYVFATYAPSVPYTETVPVETDSAVVVYKNPDELGIAYLADSGIIGWDFREISPFIVQDKTAKMLSGNKFGSMFRSVEERVFDCENIRTGSTTDAHYSYRKKNEDEPAWISYTLTADRDGPVYMYLPTKYERETQLYVNGVYRGNYFKYENYSIEYIGTFEKGEEFEVKLVLLDDAVYFTEAMFYAIDMNTLQRFGDTMRELNKSTVLERKSGTRLEMSVDAPRDCAVFTTIPAEEGWTVTVDGIPIETAACLSDALMCFPVTEGSHKIVMEFVPAGLKPGLMLSGGGACMFAAMIAVRVLIDRRKAEKAGREEQPAEAEKPDGET